MLMTMACLHQGCTVDDDNDGVEKANCADDQRKRLPIRRGNQKERHPSPLLVSIVVLLGHFLLLRLNNRVLRKYIVSKTTMMMSRLWLSNLKFPVVVTRDPDFRSYH